MLVCEHWLSILSHFSLSYNDKYIFEIHLRKSHFSWFSAENLLHILWRCLWQRKVDCPYLENVHQGHCCLGKAMNKKCLQQSFGIVAWPTGCCYTTRNQQKDTIKHCKNLMTKWLSNWKKEGTKWVTTNRCMHTSMHTNEWRNKQSNLEQTYNYLTNQH